MDNRAKGYGRMCIEDIKAEIKRLRRYILVNSYLYYQMNENLVTDEAWSEKALRLETLQREYPAESAEVEMYDEFKNFDHSTGSNLVYDTPATEWVYSKALQLLRYEHERINGK